MTTRDKTEVNRVLRFVFLYRIVVEAKKTHAHNSSTSELMSKDMIITSFVLSLIHLAMALVKPQPFHLVPQLC